MSPQQRVEDLLRDLAPQVLGALVRRYGQFDACEDAVQEALLAAARKWPSDGVPDRPRSWLLTVAGRALVPLAEQNRQAWDRHKIAEGQALLTRTLGTATLGPYQVQAAIAAVHDEAPSAEQTDWPQILVLYDVLAHLTPAPMVTLCRAVAVANTHGPKAGLAVLGTLTTDDQLAHTHRLHAVRVHLLELAGEPAAAREAYLHAARLTASVPEQRYLTLRAARLHQPAAAAPACSPPPTGPDQRPSSATFGGGGGTNSPAGYDPLSAGGFGS